MNYLAFALAILTGLIALWSFAHIAVVAVGKRRFVDSWGFPINAVTVAGFGTLTLWLASVVAA